MKKFLKLTSVLAFIVLIVLSSLEYPPIQDRIAPLAMVALLSPSDLPEEDSLSALVCGSASPLELLIELRLVSWLERVMRYIS